MSTIRTDPVTGRRVIIAAERADRPRMFREDEKDLPYTEHCPFCRGNEAATPPHIRTYPADAGSANGPNWQVRVVPNKYPAVSASETLVDESSGMFRATSGVGAHEVIIESPDHVVELHDLPDEQIARVIRAWRERISDLARDERLDYALLFKNHGAPAGASIEHAHSQLLALPLVPNTPSEEIDGARQHHADTGNCVFCQMIDQTLADGDRLVFADESMVVMAPYAPRFPFELWLLPRQHASAFQKGQAADDLAVASALSETLDRLDRALDAPPYNLVVHTAPLRSDDLRHYHWHIELIPTLSHIAGFEWGTGCHINPTPPESAAEHLREIVEADDSAPETAVAD